MGFVSAIWLILLGVLGAASLIIARRPDAEALIDKIRPYQGWIGAVSALWGVWGIIWSLRFISMPTVFIQSAYVSVFQLTLGFILGIGVLKTFIKQPEAQRKMDEVLRRLAPEQGALGLGAIGLGLLSFIFQIIT